MRRKKNSSEATLESFSGAQSPPPLELNDGLNRLRVVSELIEICSSTLQLHGLMDKVFGKVLHEVGAEAGSLWLGEETDGSNSCFVAEGPTRDKVLNLKLPKGAGIIGYVIEHAECQTVYDASKDKHFNSSVDQKTGFKTHSMICAPLVVESKAIGAIQLINKREAGGRFVPEDLNLLKLLCQVVATPIVNAKLRVSQQKVQELSTLLDISKEITSTLDLQGCMITVVNLCSKVLPYDRAAIGLIRQDRVEVSAISGLSTVDNRNSDVVNLGKLMEEALRLREDFYTPSGKKYLKGNSPNPVFAQYLGRYHQNSLALYRLSDKESDLGIFMMESKKENLISQGLPERVEILRNMLTVSLRNAQLYQSVPRFSLFRFRGLAGRFPWKKAALFVSLFFAMGLGLTFIRKHDTIKGEISVQPRQKFPLLAKTDGEVDRVRLRSGARVLKGDTIVIFNREDLLNQKSKLQSKQEMLKRTMAFQRLHSDYESLRRSELESRQMALEREIIERKFEQSILVSPVNGTLANDDILHLRGKHFKMGQELAEIIETKNRELKFLVHEDKIHLIQRDQTVRFYVSAYPGKTFEGKVRRMAFDTEEINESVYFPVLVKVMGSTSGLFPGMTGRAKISLEKKSLGAIYLNDLKLYLAKKLWF